MMKPVVVPDQYTKILGKEVSVSDVDAELRLLWELDKASTNASLINLAVYSEESDSILKNSERVQEITREHACRALLIGIDRYASEASIRAWVTTHCHLSHGRKGVCCEQIAFQLTGKSTGRLRNTVFAHLNSDLPLVFWWQGELSPIFSDRLYSLIDRFIFDSSEWANPLESFRRIERAVDEEVKFFPIDMEWSRSYQIRHAIAGLFDDPLAIKNLGKTKSVKIVVHPSHRMAGMQLLAWIVTSGGWRRGYDLGLSVEEDEGEFYFETEEGVDVTAKIMLDEFSAPISLVEMVNPQGVVRISREANSAYLNQELDLGGHVIDRCAPAGSDAAEELLMGQLSLGGKNTLYSAMMPTFLNLLGGEKDAPEAMSVR